MQQNTTTKRQKQVLNTHTHTHLIVGPRVAVGQEPGSGDGRALLRANLQRADDWDAVVITCREREREREK